MQTLEEMTEQLKAFHARKDSLCKITGKPVAASELATWKKKSKFKLPPDHEMFLREIGSCDLHVGEYDAAVRLLPIDKIVPVAPLVFGDDCDDIPVPKSWYAIADILDGNFIILDLSSVRGENADILDGCREVIPHEATIIAKSFTEFLYRALNDPDFSTGGGGGKEFWSKFDCYGDKGLDA